MIVPVILFLFAGILAGILLRGAGIIFSTDWITTPVLWVLVAAAGVEMGGIAKNKGWKSLLESARQAVSALLGTLFGTLLAGVLSGLLLNMALHRSLAVAAGFGWYTLSSVLLTELDGPQLGTLAFLSNVFREIFAFIFIPIFASRGWKAPCMSLAGATSMDTTLPLISRCCGGDTSAASFFHGFLFTLLVPVVVPFVYALPI